MVVKTTKGMYRILRNFRDAFNEELFIEKYLEECFDKDSYIVGDISAGILRLKGFDDDPKSKNYFGFIDDYLNNSCVIGSPYFILRRINENEYESLLKESDKSATLTDGFVITPLVKENFDKESLSLNSTPKDKPEINIDMEKINSLPKGNLPDYLKDDNTSKEVKQTKEPQVQTQTYVSSSNGFDPSKVQNRNQFNHNNDKFNQNKKKKNHNKNRG